jgi:hypothetical protein
MPDADTLRAICKIATSRTLLERIIYNTAGNPNLYDIYYEAIRKLIALTPEPTAA